MYLFNEEEKSLLVIYIIKEFNLIYRDWILLVHSPICRLGFRKTNQNLYNTAITQKGKVSNCMFYDRIIFKRVQIGCRVISTFCTNANFAISSQRPN